MGAIRPRANGEHFLDTTALDSLPPLALGPWLAARVLAELDEELVGLARVCAVLGDEFEREELASVAEIVEERGGATTSMDVDVGLEELVAAGILVAGPKSFTFAQALIREGIYTTTEQEERVVLHRAALDHWQTRPSFVPAVAERLARHAEVVGERWVAAEAFATIGEHAHKEHRALDADQAWTGALRHLEAPTVDRAKALIGRAQSRYRFQRVRDALIDLDEALTISKDLGDGVLELEARLQQATAMDFGEDFAGSREVASGIDVVGAPAALRSAIELARGRSLYREGHFDAAAPLFEAVLERGTVEQRTVAGLLLGCSLVELSQLARAETVFDELITMCISSNDRFHLCAAYSNRATLWSVHGAVERVAADLQEVIRIAREGGHAFFERGATYNLAEDRLWQGDLEDALRLSRRSAALAEAHGEANAGVYILLLARVLAARGADAELQGVVERLARFELAEEDRRVLEVLKAVIAGSDEAWNAALVEIDKLQPSLRIEMMKLASNHRRLSATQLEEAAGLARKSAIWARRDTEF